MNANAKKGFRTPADFINGANDAPDRIEINPAAGTMSAKPGDPAPAPPEAKAAAAASNDGATPAAATAAAAAATTPARGKGAGRGKGGATGDEAPHVHKRDTDGPKGPPPAPWAAASPVIKGPGFNFRMTQQLHAKVAWISENVPQHKSMQVVIEKAVTAYVAAVLAQHYKPE